MNANHPSNAAAPMLPRLAIGGHVVTVDSITAHGAARAMLSIRNDAGVPSPLADSAPLTRDALVSFALGLLELSDHLIEDGAYQSSDSVRDGKASVSARQRDGTRRFFRIRDRLPILQLAQRVLEEVDDHTASTLLMLLGSCSATGRMPVQVRLDVKAAENKLRAVSQNEEASSVTPS